MKKGLIALSPLAVFIVLYLVTSIIARDFYKVPITVAFMAASMYAVLISGGIPLRERIDIYSRGAAKGQMMLMIWIFILAGAFAHTAKVMGAIDATVNLALTLLPGNMLLAGLFLAACFISISVGTSVGTIVALTPIAAGVAEQTLLYCGSCSSTDTRHIPIYGTRHNLAPQRWRRFLRQSDTLPCCTADSHYRHERHGCPIAGHYSDWHHRNP